MSKPTFSRAALMTRLVVVGWGLTLFSEGDSARHLLRLDGLQGPLSTSYVYWFSLLAPAFFLWALWAASDAFAGMDRGDAFGPAMIKALKTIGTALMLGAFAAIVVQPTLIFLIGNGSSEMRGVQFNLDIENLTLALVGLILILLARQGRNLKTKLDEFV